MRRMNSARWAVLVLAPAMLAGCSGDEGSTGVPSALDGDRLYNDAVHAAQRRRAQEQRSADELDEQHYAMDVSQLNGQLQSCSSPCG